MALNIFKFLVPIFILIFCCHVSAFSNYGYVKFNETCVDSDSCIDYKMICSRVETDEMRCLCSDILYIWSDQLQECIMDSDKLKRWLFRVQRPSDDSGEINSKEFNAAFLVMTLCGVLIVLALLVFLGIMCILLGRRQKNVIK